MGSRATLMHASDCVLVVVGHHTDAQLAASYGGCSVSYRCPPLLHQPDPTASCAVPLKMFKDMLAEIAAIAARQKPPERVDLPTLEANDNSGTRVILKWRVHTTPLKIKWQKSRVISCITRDCASLPVSVAVKWDESVPMAKPKPGDSLHHGVIHPVK